jgi:7-carboxy-7-deazaguanine synthase
MSDGTLVVSEVFGPTVQGEGPSLGRRAGFVRLGRCNLACAYCDTPYSWDWERFDPATELSERTVDEIMDELEAMNVPMVVITGGEPLLQQRALPGLVDRLRQTGVRIEIETSGTLPPATADLCDQWNVSPKLANSGMSVQRRYKPDVLRTFEATGRAVFKFVAVDVSDLDEIGAMVEECGLRNVWVMPEGTEASTITARLAELAPATMDRGWNLTTRLHILLWGDRRGV